MTKREIEKQLAETLRLFDLTEWRVQVADDDFEGIEHKDGSREVGRMNIFADDMTAILKIATKREDQLVTRTVRHEAQHLLLSPMASIFDDTVRLLGGQAGEAFRDQWERAEEQAVERIIRAIARMKGEKGNHLGD